jgi:3-oxoacyl-[acyl-carrier-protein] synthase-3
MPVSASIVLGCGAALPPRVVTNEELSGPLDAAPAAIAERTGITRRRWVEPGIGPSDLGRDAAARAVAAAGRTATDVDLIVFATMTPDIAFPGSGCFLQDKLGCDTVGAIDVRAQDAGFVFALATADRFIRAGAATQVLVVGAEVYSTALELRPRAASVSPRFGDAGGAILLGAGDAPGVVATVMHTDPSGFERYWCEFPSSRHYPARMDMEHFEAGRHYYVLDASALDAQAEPTLRTTTEEVLAQAGVRAGAVDLCIATYLDPRVARRAVVAAGIADARVVVPAESVGHVGAAGIPMALADAMGDGRIGPGAVVCCVAFGAGISWAGAVLRL